MKRFLLSALTVSVIAVSQNTAKEPSGAAKKYEVLKKTEGGYLYETVSNDPLKARIYTLPNGLKVYMTVYKDAPRIQTYVAVAAGSKTDRLVLPIIWNISCLKGLQKSGPLTGHRKRFIWTK
jgi:hypothetical protein